MLTKQIQLAESLCQREKQGTLRKLQVRQANVVDFYSNDYLGMARNPVFHAQIRDAVMESPNRLAGATGARLISGQTADCLETEEFVAQQQGFPAALFFPSGYLANLALFSCVAGRGELYILDELVHRSVYDGCRLSHAQKWKFKHNDLNHLEALLQQANRFCFIAVESLYSMDGDFAPLLDLCQLAKRYHAALIVDEAHAFGVFGWGLVAQANLQQEVFATLITYGKAMGLHGAAILGSETLVQYLVNFASAFIYSTASPAIQAYAIALGYKFLAADTCSAQDLQANIRAFRNNFTATLSQDSSPIQSIRFADTAQLKACVLALEKENMASYAIYSPTVKANQERLRICLHAFNTAAEITSLTGILKKYH